MKKQQLILIGSGVGLFCLIYFFGQTIPPKSKTPPPAAAGAAGNSTQSFDIKAILASAKEQLNPSQQSYISQLESAVVRGDVKEQQIKVYKQIAAFWRDSAHLLLPYAYYSGLASKLENSEKSLTFAAHYFLVELRQQPNPDLKTWLASEAKEMFEKALAINPNNDSTKIGLGSCYLFGNISENPMQGIQMIREVADRDTTNMFAQFMLGLGGLQSGQFDKAIERLIKVVAKEPKNTEAVVALAESYERKGDKVNAIKWYEISKQFFTEQEILNAINARIDQLKK